MMIGLVESDANETCTSPAAHAVATELHRLENQLKDKERELGVANTEIKALKVSEVLKDKAVMELRNELKKLEEKLRATDKLVEQKNLEIKRLIDERKEAFAAQFAAEAALRRVHASQKDDDDVPLEAIIAPFESDIKMYRSEIKTLREDKKALERLVKTKEMTLIDAEKILKSALERALIVETIQNENLELKRQMEIFQEENRILEKINRQKIAQVEKLSRTVTGLEESILPGWSTDNVMNDYKRQISQLCEEKRILERELARATVSANRVATVVANEWKDDSEKVISVKQWLEERKFMQGKIQRLCERLSVLEKSAKAEAQIKEKLRLRLKTLEEGLKHGTSLSAIEAESSDFGTKKISTSPSFKKLSVLKQPNLAPEGADSSRHGKRSNSLKAQLTSGEKLVKNNLSAPRSRSSTDHVGKENSNGNENEAICSSKSCDLSRPGDCMLADSSEDLVSGFLYDRVQKEVILLRKSQKEREEELTNKNEEIKMLQKKVEVLTKSLDIESKKMKRGTSNKEREVAVPKTEDGKNAGAINSNNKRHA